MSSTHPEPEAPRGVRPARPQDVARVWELIREFAAFERLAHLATGSAERLAAHLFGGAWPALGCVVAEVDGTIAGYAIFLGAYSTFWTEPLLWLEDLYVSEPFRGRGLGRALMAEVAREAIARGCPRMDWAVLDWNSSAIEFYQRLGAEPSGGWQTYRLSGERLRALAGEARVGA